jgi:L-asparaginase II
MTASSPLTVEIIRGPAVESRHHVHAVLMDGQGKTKAVYGDARRLTFPRSTLKPLQSIALLESGAADAFKVSEDEIALAAASHNGEEIHTGRVKKWLSRIGLDETALECGAHAPYGIPCQTPFSTLHNNCSGKHTGMLTLSLFLKATPAGYTKPEHAVQKLILSTLTEVCGDSLTPACCGIDGCSAPNPAMPLENLARGFAAFMQHKNRMGGARGSACDRIFRAMAAHPDLVGGTKDRLDTVLMNTAQGKIVSKTGAEGTYIAVIPGKDTVLALKTEDGAARAGQAALYGLLEKYKLADDAVMDAIRPLALPVIKNWRGLETGKTQVL